MTGEQQNFDREPTADERAGIAWWNAMTETERAYWLSAAQTPTPAVAWAYYQCQQARDSGTDRPLS